MDFHPMLLLFSALMDKKTDSLKDIHNFYIYQEVIKSVREACFGHVF